MVHALPQQPSLYIRPAPDACRGEGAPIPCVQPRFEAVFWTPDRAGTRRAGASISQDSKAAETRAHAESATTNEAKAQVPTAQRRYRPITRTSFGQTFVFDVFRLRPLLRRVRLQQERYRRLQEEASQEVRSGEAGPR